MSEEKNRPSYLGETHDEFVRKLVKSQESVKYFAKYLKEQGIEVEVPELRISPNTEDRAQYSDAGDLLVTNEDGVNYFEVKQLSTTFTSREDFPYPTIIVNSITGWRTKQEKPLYHILLSKDRQYFARVHSDTFDSWVLTSIWDSRKKRKLQFYVTDIANVEFFKIQDPFTF